MTLAASFLFRWQCDNALCSISPTPMVGKMPPLPLRLLLRDFSTCAMSRFCVFKAGGGVLQTSSPQISSIEFDSEGEGYKAADLALKMVSSHKGTAARTICCGAVKRIVERESTRPPAPTTVLIERAMKFIAENATKRIGPQDVADNLGVSRTLLDLRFRENGNATVGRQILEKRLSALSSMLRKSKVPISRMIKECGFGSVNHAKAVFKNRFGMSMRDWRKQNLQK